MKKTLLLASLLLAAGANAADNLITLDLTKSTTKLEFNETNGSWIGTFDDDAATLDSQVFSFLHSSMGDYNTWWGFTASNSADNARKENFLDFQWSNMAQGGIELNEDGTVKLDKNGSPVVNAAVPYMVGYYMAYMGKRPTDMIFTTKSNYDPQGVYVNLTTYPYYCLEYGLAPARPFTNGDNFKLTIHGVAPDESEKTVEVTLCSYADGDITINRGWKYVDLTPLGTVNELYFTMESTDSDTYGVNTPCYFALDKLTVAPAAENGIAATVAAGIELSYNRTTQSLTWSGAEFADVQNALGQTVMASDSGEMNLSALAAGVYVARAGAKTLKFVK